MYFKSHLLMSHLPPYRLVDEWIPLDSSRLRPLQDNPPVAELEPIPEAGPSEELACPSPALLEPKFKVNEKCLARWSDSRKFKATVKTILPNGK